MNDSSVHYSKTKISDAIDSNTAYKDLHNEY